MNRAARFIESIPGIVLLAAQVGGMYWSARSRGVGNDLRGKAFEDTYAISERLVFQMKAAKFHNLPKLAQNIKFNMVYLTVSIKVTSLQRTEARRN